jgi:hypothetical protein
LQGDSDDSLHHPRQQKFGDHAFRCSGQGGSLSAADGLSRKFLRRQTIWSRHAKSEARFLSFPVIFPVLRENFPD